MPFTNLCQVGISGWGVNTEVTAYLKGGAAWPRFNKTNNLFTLFSPPIRSVLDNTL